MRRLVLSTDDVPDAERFSYWREAVGEGLLGTSAERSKGQETTFNARADVSIGASFARFRFRTDGYPVFRRPHDIARVSWGDYICLYSEYSVGVWFGENRRELVTERGDLVIGDLITPFASQPRANFDSDVWLFPRNLFDPHLPASLYPHSLVLAGHSGLRGMVKAYLDSFGGQIDALDDREAGLVAANFGRLLAVACGASASEHQEAIGEARLEEVKQYINLHLADPELTPERAAAALKISVRQLHLLFEPSGTSFAQYVLNRRLDECRAAIVSQAGHRSVTDVALGWGFNNLSTFYRTFRQTFGASPGELRERVVEGA